ncbi:hypothetical protein LCGC14_2342040 [marine sediment metagenome]|uniref:Uncharacterized protein n=1 Tax=marine sediment metagenome TaxID=412755 RepID=A0A0F9CZC0_9ZZZZ
MDAFQFSDAIEDLLDDLPEEAILYDEVRRTRSFERADVLTSNAGIVVRMKGGTEFQLTIVQSEREQG